MTRAQKAAATRARKEVEWLAWVSKNSHYRIGQKLSIKRASIADPHWPTTWRNDARVEINYIRHALACRGITEAEVMAVYENHGGDRWGILTEQLDKEGYVDG